MMLYTHQSTDNEIELGARIARSYYPFACRYLHEAKARMARHYLQVIVTHALKERKL
jgi:hypothetical protein